MRHGGCSLNGHGISTLNIQVFGGGPLYCFRALRGGRPVVAAPIIVTGGMPTEGPARCTVLRGKRGRFHTVVAKVAGVIRSFSLEEVPGPD